VKSHKGKIRVGDLVEFNIAQGRSALYLKNRYALVSRIEDVRYYIRFLGDQKEHEFYFLEYWLRKIS